MNNLPPGVTERMIDEACGPREIVCTECGIRHLDEDDECPGCVMAQRVDFFFNPDGDGDPRDD